MTSGGRTDKRIAKFDADYVRWVEELSKRYQASQIKASIRVNSEMLKFYWRLGQDIVSMNAENHYGSSFYKRLSNDLRNAIPQTHSFSVTNLKYMKYFYEMYPNVEIRPQAGDESRAIQNRPQLEDEFDSLKAIFCIPWGHNKRIIDRCKGDQQKALFYVRKVLENNWSRAVLMNFLDTDLYERKGKAITNFSLTLPTSQSELAQEMTRDPYNFDFLTIREHFDEKELKDALMDSIERFLLELGQGFAFMGREVRIEVGNTEKFIDMLFYHIPLKCYVVLEVKVTDFDSSYAGQLGTYVVAINHQMKTKEQNPTIGLLVCKSMDRVEARYAIESSSQPIGVSGYELSKLIPDNFKGSLPTIEEIEAELSTAESGR